MLKTQEIQKKIIPTLMHRWHSFWHIRGPLAWVAANRLILKFKQSIEGAVALERPGIIPEKGFFHMYGIPVQGRQILFGRFYQCISTASEGQAM